MVSQVEVIGDLQMLNQITETLNRAVDVGSVLNTTLARLVDLMGLKTGWIFVREPTSQERWGGKGYVVAAHYNLPPALRLDNPDAWNKGCDCQGLCNRNQLNKAYNEVRCSRLAEASGDRQGLVVHASTPLFAGEQALGILNVAAVDWASFNPRSLALLTNVGHQIGIALERARLYDLLQEQRGYEQAILLDLTNQLLSRLDLDEMMKYLLEEVRRLLRVDACALLLPGDDRDYLYFRAAIGWKSNPVANGHRVPMDSSGSGRVMRTQQPLLLGDYGETTPWRADWVRGEDFRAAAIVPLIVAGYSIGTLVIDTRQPRRFEESEIRFLQLMANQAALAMEKARLHQADIQRHRIEEELAVSRQIQLSMLPDKCPVVPGWQLAAVYEAARQVGGDFYDFFPLPGEPAGQLGLVIADVSDKGVPAALFMAMARTTIRNSALRGHSPGETLLWANRLIRQDSHSDMFLTAFYAALDTNSGHLRFANAGHDRPLWWRATTGEFKELAARGIVLGVLDEVELEEREITVEAGDILIFYTDGITEAMNERFEEFGLARLKTAVAGAVTAASEMKGGISAENIAGTILESVIDFTGGAPQHDDFTCLVVRREESEAR